MAHLFIIIIETVLPFTNIGRKLNKKALFTFTRHSFYDDSLAVDVRKAL